MKRREFIKKVSLATAGGLVLPYILPSGRLFAQTGSQSAQHVVLVMFAGGVRQQESVLQRYLEDSQGMTVAGNIMYNMFDGAPPNLKIAYGTGPGGINPIPKMLSSTIQQQGTLFKEVGCLNAGHYGGYNAILQGADALSQGLRQRPLNPTIFEYLRRHTGAPATKTWFVGNGVDASIPLLNYSVHPSYGPNYGANFFAPNVTFGGPGQAHFSKGKVYHPEDELKPMYEMKYFLDNSYANVGKPMPDLKNTFDEKQDIKAFMKHMFDKTAAGSINHPPVNGNGDSSTIGYTCELLDWFKPTLTVVNLSAVDTCHENFTGYLGSLHAADHAVAHLWKHIQTIPEMAGNTTMIITPECGRNKTPNSNKDLNDWNAFDHHDSDKNARRVFLSMVGSGVPANLTIGDETHQIGMNTDCVLTIAEILGFKNEIMSTGMPVSKTKSLFDYI